MALNVSNIPVTYKPQKAQKCKIIDNELYKVDVLGFNQKIGYITNISTTIYEMQSQYEENSAEFEELETRGKLCCKLQSVEIDSQKGIAKKPIFKHWTKYRKISEEEKENLSELEISEIEFDNKLVIDKRPYFMRHIYSKRNREYQEFKADFNRYSQSMWGVKFNEIPNNIKKTQEYINTKAYYDQKNPLLETNGIMNRLCRHMEKELKEVKKQNKTCDNSKIFNILFNTNIPIDEIKLEQIKEKLQKYNDFKQSKMLKTSEFHTYEQFYKRIRNECLVEISNDIQELANLAVYLCYSLMPKKKKDFCWDCFGTGIVQNLQSRNNKVMLPQKCEDGDFEYLGDKYKMVELDLEKNKQVDTFGEITNNDFNDFNVFEDLVNDDFECFEDLEL